ncbi:MAG TPA: PilZ domain-containing protein [Holophaga sp.]|mgnify:CR=1 FL=1|nr:PilZ domain-containing protein [Holophaga sp.]
MKLPFFDAAPPAGAITGIARDAILDELCDRKHPLLLATTYLRFEARFLERHGEELRIRIALGRDAVKHTLQGPDLRMRFDWGLAFVGGSTRVLGYEQDEARRILRLQVPSALEPDEQRRHYRLERVGRSGGAICGIAGADSAILRVTLENISISGASVFVLEPLAPDRYHTGQLLRLSLALEQGPTLELQGRLCHSEDQTLGFAFHPAPEGSVLEALSRWLEPRILDARRRWQNRAELRAQAEQAIQPKRPPEGVILITSSESLADQMASALNQLQPLRAMPPAMGPMKDAQLQPPLLLMVDATESDAEARHRIRSLLEKAPFGAPILVLGDGQGMEAARQLATELKAATCLAWNPQQEVFFRRLVRGLIHHRWKAEQL